MAAEARRGFALIFVVVTLAVMLILATVVLANSAGEQQRFRIQTTTTALRRFRSELGSQTFQPSYFGDVKVYPHRLSYLYVRIAAVTDSNSCSAPYVGSDVSKWIGPYHLIPMLRNNPYQIEPGIILEDVLERNPPTGASNAPAILSLVMNNVSLADAQDLGTAFDGISTGAGPIITFTPSGSNPVTVRYNIDIIGC